ncbi:MAG: hypothetical protein DWQ10_11945 [Calditrichaeota bacterium]|nr:MAG: hypothetical protein DWQ10_11945 [Calditrichota bacterium]
MKFSQVRRIYYRKGCKSLMMLGNFGVKCIAPLTKGNFMKNYRFVFYTLGVGLLVFGILFESAKPLHSSPPMKRYKVKSGIVKYKVSGMQEGTEIVYFDKWGMLEAKYTQTEMSMMGMKQKTNTLTLLDGEWTYTVDFNTNTGTKMKTPLIDELTKNAKNKDLTDVGKKMMQDMGGKKIGMEKVAGKLCEVWEIKSMNSKTWVWNGVPFKNVVGFGGMNMASVAESAEFNVTIPKEKVTLPKGITFREMQNPLQNKMMPGNMFQQ